MLIPQKVTRPLLPDKKGLSITLRKWIVFNVPDKFVIDDKHSVRYFITTYLIIDTGINPAAGIKPLSITTNDQYIVIQHLDTYIWTRKLTAVSLWKK